MATAGTAGQCRAPMITSTAPQARDGATGLSAPAERLGVTVADDGQTGIGHG